MTEVKTIKWKDENIVLSIDYPKEEYNEYKTVIICHGLIGSRVGVDRLFVKTSNLLTEKGYLVIRFDYKGCGESSGEYGSNRLSDLIEQTEAIIQFAYEEISIKELILLGHSLGGAVALCTAINDSRVSRLIQWAAVGNPAFDIRRIFGADRLSELAEKEVVDFNGYSFYQTYFESLAEYHPLEICHYFSGDVLLAHGSADQDIPYHYMNEYKNNYLQREMGSVEVLLIENGKHTFSSASQFNELISGTIQWLESK
ncbi:alpha/beta hydrolase [Niallia sp.]|uniref:alpha/beta hydrolase family protein n=1 Tax=Niallia sp. TaxID=2837523 RepID=UPI0028A29C9C|nr:alpha/beta hydrolase [Niallia sp.]